MKTIEIKQLANKELLERIDEEKESLLRMRLNHAVSPIENPLKIKGSRRLIARLNTELRKRELEGTIE